MKMILIFLLFCHLPGMAESPSLRVVRALYQKAATDEKSCRELIRMLTPYTEENNPLFLGYKAGATMIMARHVLNPVTKLRYFQEGKKMLEKAIEANKNNMELRYLRFSIQSNAPSFLGYKDEISLDKAVLIESIPRMDTGLKHLVISVLSSSDYLNETEKRKLVQ